MLMSAPDNLGDLPEYAQLEPLPLKPAETAQSEFPVNCMGPLLTNTIRSIGVVAGVPLGLAAQSVLAACSLATQGFANVQLPTRQVRPISLFLVTVADSSDRKSTADDFAMHAIREYQTSLQIQHAAERQEAVFAQTAWEESKKAIVNSHRTKGKETLEAHLRELGPKPEGPVDPTIVFGNGTTQGFLKRLVTSRPSLGLMSSEGGTWIGGYSMSEDNRINTLATFSQFWDGSTIENLTAGDGHTALHGRRLTFHLMVQSRIASRLLGDDDALDQGFLSRLLVSKPTSLVGTRFKDLDKAVDQQHFDNVDIFSERLGQIIRAQLPIDENTGGLVPRVITMNDAASRTWWEFYNELEAGIGPEGPYRSVKGFVGKLPEMAARLAVVLALFTDGASIRELTPIQLYRGVELARFYLTEALRLYGRESVPQDVEDADEISRWLAEKWSEPLVTVSAISNSGPSRVRNKARRIRPALKILEQEDHVAFLPNGGVVNGKKARQAWRVIVGRS